MPKLLKEIEDSSELVKLYQQYERKGLVKVDSTDLESDKETILTNDK